MNAKKTFKITIVIALCALSVAAHPNHDGQEHANTNDKHKSKANTHEVEAHVVDTHEAEAHTADTHATADAAESLEVAIHKVKAHVADTPNADAHAEDNHHAAETHAEEDHGDAHGATSHHDTKWTDTITIKGDVIYRYKHKSKDGDVYNNYHAFQAHVGFYADITDEVSAGVRLATGDNDGPTGNDQKTGHTSSQKNIWLDQAYMIYSPNRYEGLSLTFGKMVQPWIMVSDLMFDTDVHPEGIAVAYNVELDNATVLTRLGYHIIDLEAEHGSDYQTEIELATSQIGISSEPVEDIKITAAAGLFTFKNLADSHWHDPHDIIGNTEGSSTNLVYDYELVDGSAKLEIHKGPIHFKVFGEYIRNMASGVREDTAWLAGVGAHYKKLDVKYNFRDMDADSVFGYLADSDFGGPGGSGHKIKLKYQLQHHWYAALTYFRVEDDHEHDIDLFKIDLIAKF